MIKVIKQILIILILSVVVGLVVNAVNPKGIPLVMDMKKYSTEQSDKLKEDFINNPYDTTKKDASLMQNPRINKEGFVEPQNIKLDFAKVLFDRKALFFDGRKPEEYNAGHIKGAINIYYEEFHKKSKEEKTEILKGFNKNGLIVCYCIGGDCEASIDLAYDIAKLGFTSLNIYLGGYKEWEDAGYPVEK
ncbi:MAG: rhodanese-like domain-containing protein [Ignavibacteriae bacterium]|nr:rhodanese-like domain-containing protein [Ignavibacteriota bacterium]